MEGIAGLKTRYCEWLDGKQWDRWASLFTDVKRTLGEALYVGLGPGERP